MTTAWPVPWGPRGDPTEWSSWGEEAQWRERALPLAAKRAIRNLLVSTTWGATTSARHPPAGGAPGGACAGAGLPGRGPHFFPKKWGERRAGGLRPPLAPPNGGSWRRWAVTGWQEPGVHCRPLRRHKLRIARFAASGKARSLHCASSPHRTRFAGLRRGPRYWFRYRRCRASGGTHRDYLASPDSCCAVPAWPAGPPLVPCRRTILAVVAAHSTF